MKKLLATTALLLCFANFADARERFPNLRPSQPSIEVNLGALRYLQPDSFGGGYGGGSIRPEPVYRKPVKPYQGTQNQAKVAPKIQPKKPEPKEFIEPIAVISEIKTPEKKSLMPIKKLEMPALEAQKPILPSVTEFKPVLPAPTPAIMQPSKMVPPLPKPTPGPIEPAMEKKPAPEMPLEMPKLSELPKPVVAAEPVKLPMPTLPKAIVPEVDTKISTVKPLETKEIKDLSLPKLSLPQAEPKNLAAPELKTPEPTAPKLPELPEIATPTKEQLSIATLPPLFPDDEKLSAPPPNVSSSTQSLPPVSSLFNDSANKTEAIELPKLPDTSSTIAPQLSNDGKDVPAPAVANVQMKQQIPNQPSFDTTGTKPALSFPFNETETDMPLSEQSSLIEIVEALKLDPKLAATVNSYASGTSEQSSQSKRTSLARALSVRRFMLERNVAAEQIIIRPYGNQSGNGIPDRVDIVVSKKAEG